MKNFALVGNPNCGKTTLFNSLTGSTAHVGNWPGVTVDKREGTCSLGKEEVNIIDLPGIYSLSPYTPEEVITRNYIMDNNPDCVINIVDATNLERNLYLTTQLMEMDVPIIVALNMMDVLEENGDKIDINGLETALGLPVIAVSALKESNIQSLIDSAIKASKIKREGTTVLVDSPLKHLIRDLTIAFHTLDVPNPLFHACKLAELDEVEVKDHPQFRHMVVDFREENVSNDLSTDYEAVIADARYKYITKNYAIHLEKAKKGENTVSRSDKIDKILTHKFWGIPIFIAILFLVFHLTFSENFLFLGNLIKNDSFSGLKDNQFWNGLVGSIWHNGGINSPGVILGNLVDGITKAFTELVRGWLTNAPEWIGGFICDGILGGLFAVLGFLPQILVLFLLFSILEDSGYMARVAFILDKLFRKFGLSGRAFLPMIMGFGCSVPAMINTRTIADEKERISTIRVIPFFSCGAKLPTLTAIAGCIASSFGFANVDLITLGMYVLGMATAIVCVLIMRNTTLRGNSSPFIMELPTYHMPQFKSTMLLVWDKAKHFIQKAFTVILASTIVIWFISHFGTTDDGLWAYIGNDMQNSILAMIGKIIQPFFVPVGFGLGKYGWVFVVAAISGLIAKENVVATFGTLACSILAANGLYANADTGLSVFIAQLSQESSILYDPFFAQHGEAILLAFIAFNMFTIPCFATIATAKAELGKKKFGMTILFWILVSYVISSCIFLTGSFIWPIAIYIVVLAVIFILIYIFNKKKQIQKEAK